DNAAKMHEEIGIYARDLGIEHAYFVGKHSIQAAKQFGENGLWFDEKTPLVASLIQHLPEKASILVKGSRFMQMETIVDALLDTVQQK
ncbi:MAG: UDP-N-acetylmuramoyl-tripeptide--D-alanyl-D-alanine ligase, partial [Neisseriaceae bacterium]|nr:UDP-N-acetylmuramoyl-tripeptide--D-alanyl-D-alanine ligase [Neisseriaceae bacterium]